MENLNSKTRVLVIGLDGATLDIIRPMVKKGRLPNFSRLMRNGFYAPLKSSIPPITPCAWPSFATGKDPSKHGLYDFYVYDFSIPMDHPQRQRRVNRTFVRAKSLWKILSEAGKRSIVVDVPVTYPPEDINGIMISRVMAPARKNCAYPKLFYNILKRKGFIESGRDKIEDMHQADNKVKEEIKDKIRRRKPTKAEFKKIRAEGIRRTLKGIIDDIEKNTRLAEWLMKKEDWDFFMVVFMSADIVGHSLWLYKRKVEKVYQELDRAVGRLFECAGDSVIKFIMSDHGFTSIPYSFNLNEWLYINNLLSKKILPSRESIKNLKELMRDIRIGNRQAGGKRKAYRLPNYTYRILPDYSKSKAYLQSDYGYGLRINLKGRDAEGIVGRQEYETLRDHIINKLRKIKHPLTGARLFSLVSKKEDVYSKSPLNMDAAPDILLLTKDMKVYLYGIFEKKGCLFTKNHKGFGFHHTDGIFFASGRYIKKAKINHPKITDIMPTILHILDVPLPSDLDGGVLCRIFKENCRYAKQKPSYQGPSIIRVKAQQHSRQDEKSIKERLAALGYME